MPFDPLAQLEGDRLLVGTPDPAFRQIRDDDVEAVLRLRLIEQDQIVEDRHEWIDGRDGGFLMDRGRGWIVTVIQAQRSAGLRLLRAGGCYGRRKRDRHQAEKLAHVSLPEVIRAGSRTALLLPLSAHANGCDEAGQPTVGQGGAAWIRRERRE